jgi:metal-responsive CopG/Arc/MetJ family transcriptional regulator
MTTLTRIPTTEMEVTSIRLERDLKERLKSLSSNQGYQALIRDILWNYVQQRSHEQPAQVDAQEIRARLAAIAAKDEHCALTGRAIRAGEEMFFGLTTTGNLVPLSPGS